ncbi:Uncharacterized membrane-anchored protein [Methylobacterium sp. UNC378MF]|uniref:Membrane-anchored protein n=1 Tax=Methylobacterium oryzae TaxID=334852 RepID=A0ABU7TLK0_9HYPH|nr:hypothetical protein [Methylobacterium sp. UNC378MF]SDA17272.1 Uncharacterized membrane-anchored protein [Methylobacterium sp. UNC378MF]
MQAERRSAPSKVPAVTRGYWIIKIVATTLGEVGGNAVTLTLGLGYLAGTAIFASALIVLLAAQFRAERFNSLLYWAVITATTLAGTTLADFCDRSLGIGYPGGSILLLSLVVATLVLWKRTLGTIAVETVHSPKAEGFYWAAIMFSQTLGTALGDWMADSTGLGYNGSAALIAVALAVVAGLHFLTKVSRPLLFWAAFVLTRPLGATLANSLDKPAANGGLGISDITISAVLAAAMVACVLLIPQRAGHDLEDREAA